MKKFRKKPVVIEAVKFNAEKWIYERKQAFPMVETEKVTDGSSSLGSYFTYQPVIETLEGNMIVSDGDYIIKGVQGEFYPCKPDIFEQTYEEVVE